MACICERLRGDPGWATPLLDPEARIGDEEWKRFEAFAKRTRSTSIRCLNCPLRDSETSQTLRPGTHQASDATSR